MTDATRTTATGGEVQKRVTIPQAVEDAFRLFTDEIGQWWPLRTHSVGGADATGVVLEGAAGGRIVETRSDGSTSVWGTVQVWEPPHRLVTSWHPGTPEAEATEVEVSFAPAPGGGTTVVLVHRGWDRRPDGKDMRTSYDSGWDLVLGCFVSGASG